MIVINWRKDREAGGWQRLVNFTPISPSNLYSDRVVRF